jgi:mannose-6-phosphate isomerase-like protein (cupin superfamily)
MAITPEQAFDNLLIEMAKLFEQEERIEADETAAILRDAVGNVKPPLAKPFVYDDQVDDAWKNSTHPCAVAAREASRYIQWETTAGILDTYIPPEVSASFAGNAIMGPGCLIDHPDFRAGLYMQRPNSYYRLHHHEAVETYIMIEGTGDWTQGEVTTRYDVEGIIHHPSYMPHAFRTFEKPLVAIWRWSGNINPNTYSMLPDPNE